MDTKPTYSTLEARLDALSCHEGFLSLLAIKKPHGKSCTLTGVHHVVQKAEEDGIGTGFRTYAQDPRQERQGPSLPSPQQRPVEGWREDSQGARWQGPPAEVSSTTAPMAYCCMKVSLCVQLSNMDDDAQCGSEGMLLRRPWLIPCQCRPVLAGKRLSRRWLPFSVEGVPSITPCESMCGCAGFLC